MLNPFLSPIPVDYEVDGKTYQFYPISTKVLFQLRGLAKPLARALGVLLTSSQNDYGKETVEVKAPDDGYQIRTSIQPITSDLAKARHEQRQMALDQLVDGLMSEGSSTMLALMVMDSMRDTFARTPTPAQLAAFVNETPATVLVEMLMGVAAANKKLFDPLKARVTEMTATLRSTIAKTQPEEQPSTPSPEVTPGTTSG